jgi:hypothetical protein
VDEMAKPPGGETLHDVHMRCLTFLFDLVGHSTEGDVVVVAHDGTIRMLRAIAADVGLAQIEWEAERIVGPQQLRLPSTASTTGTWRNKLDCDWERSSSTDPRKASGVASEGRANRTTDHMAALTSGRTCNDLDESYDRQRRQPHPRSP